MNDFANPTGIDWAGAHYGTVRFGEDAQKVVIFYTRSVEIPAKSIEKGTRYFENQIFIKIHEPGERLNIVDRPVKEEDKDRFPTQWARFVHNKTQIPDGTPIDLLFPNNPAVADNLRAHGIHTIQQCAKLSANAIDTVGMGAQEYVNMANAYLSNASDGTAFLKIQQEIKDLKQTIKIKDQHIAKLIQQVDTLVAAHRNPDMNRIQPPWIQGHDAQTERINATHVTNELAKQRTKKKKPIIDPPADEVEQIEIMEQAAEETYGKD